jgi:hypothetical protein
LRSAGPGAVFVQGHDDPITLASPRDSSIYITGLQLGKWRAADPLNRGHAGVL